MALHDVRETPAGEAVWKFYRELFRPGSDHVWNAQDLEATSDGKAVYFIGQCFEGELEDGPSSSAWRLDVDSGQLSEVVAGAGLFRITPDNQRAVCLSRLGEGLEQLRLVRLPDCETIEQIPITGRVEAASWSPDGECLLLIVAGAEADVSGVEGGFALRALSRGPNWLPEVTSSDGGDQWRQAMLWRQGSAAPRPLTLPPTNVWEAAWLGNDRLLAVASDHHSEGSWYSSGLRVLEVSSGREISNYLCADQLGVPAGSPDGHHSAFIEAVCSDRGIICGRARLMKGDSSPLDLSLAGVEVTDLRWRDSRRLLYAGLRDSETVIGEYDLVSQKQRELWSSDRITVGGWYPHVTPFANDEALAVIESYNQAPAIARVGEGSEGVIRDLAPKGGAAVSGRMEHVRWTGRDGLEITGWLILPEGADRQLPLLVDVHGGPIAAHRNRYAAAFRADPVLVAQGWAVFLPNPRGSGGRGQDFARRVVSDMGGEDAHDILCGIEQLVLEKIADPERVAIFGTSYGGFMSATMLAFHRRFAAAIPMSPVVNWYSQHFASQIPWFDEVFLGGSPREPGGPYFDRSAVFHLDGVTTPTLVIGGARDKNTPPDQAVQLFNGLVEAGAAAELVIYPEDGHSLRGYPAYLDSATRIIHWLQQHVRSDQ